jgi:GNAT superfamily N-acetyltransferase
MVVVVRVATHADAGGIGRVSAATGQPSTDSGADASYVEHLLSRGTVLVAETDGWVRGWGAIVTTPVGVLLTDLFVDPAWQGMAIGRRILAGLWPDVAALGRFTFSSRHTHALPVYVRAGLLPRWPLLYLAGEPDRTVPDFAVSRTNPTGAAAADAQLTGGADRRADYRYWLHDGGYGLIVADGPRLVAAGAVTDTTLHHLTVGDQRDAEPALRSVLGSLPGPLMLCLPGPHPGADRSPPPRLPHRRLGPGDGNHRPHPAHALGLLTRTRLTQFLARQHQENVRSRWWICPTPAALIRYPGCAQGSSRDTF